MPKDDTPKIRLEYEPNDKEHETLKFVYERYIAMKESEDRRKYEKKWDKWMKQWENWRNERKADEWQSNHVVPITISVVETALSEVIEQNMMPLILPRGREDVPKAKVMNDIFQYSWEVSDGDLAIYDVAKNALIYGTAIAQEYYWQDRRVIQKTSLGKDKKQQIEETEILDYDDVYLENVRLQDLFIDEKGRNFNGPFAARDVIRRYIMHIEDFRQMFSGEIWNPLGNAKYVKPGGDTNYYEFYKPPEGIEHGEDVEVLWYWSIRPKDRLVIIANDVVVKDGPNPYRHKKLPFARAIDIKRPDSFYGKGEAELLESIQDEANTLRRMVIDRNHLDIDKMFLVSNRLSLSDEDLIARPHGLIPTDDVNGAKPVEYGDIPRSVELSLKHLEDDATISTGINPRAQALPTAGTATEAAILKESTLKRIRLKLWLLRKEFLTTVSRLRVANILQFYPQPKLEKIVGERGTQSYEAEISKLREQGLLTTINKENYRKSYRQITLEDKEINFDEKGNLMEVPSRGINFFELKPEYFVPTARGGYDIRFEASSTLTISKPLMQTKDLELYDRLIQLALAVPNSYDPVKLGDMVLESYDKDPNDYKIETQGEEQTQQRLEMLIQLAGMENKMLISGKEVGPTPNASPAHTRVHLEFMNSPTFQNLPGGSPIIVNFTDHVVGEIMAQETRGQGMPMMGNGETMRTSASQGITNRPGGMAQPTTKVSDILPALNTGGSRNLP